MQPGDALGDETLRHLGGDVDADSAYRCAILLFTGARGVDQPPFDALGQNRPRQLDHPSNRGKRRDRHDLGDDRLGALLGVGRGDAVAQAEVELDVEEQLGDRVLGARAKLAHQDAGVVVEIGSTVMALGERGDTDVELAEFADEVDEFFGVGDALGMLDPLTERISRRITAQRKDIGDALVGVRTDQRAQFGDRMVHRGQVGHRHQRGLGRQLTRDPHGAITCAAARPVRQRDERGIEPLEDTDRAPQACLALGVFGWEELDGEGHLSRMRRRQTFDDGRHRGG